MRKVLTREEYDQQRWRYESGWGQARFQPERAAAFLAELRAMEDRYGFYLVEEDGEGTVVLRTAEEVDENYERYLRSEQDYADALARIEASKRAPAVSAEENKRRYLAGLARPEGAGEGGA